MSAKLSDQDLAAVEEAKKNIKKTAKKKPAKKKTPGKPDKKLTTDTSPPPAEMSLSACESDADEVDEIYALQAIDRLADHGNQDALRRIKERANQRMKEHILKKFKPTIEKYQPTARKIIDKAVKVKNIVDKIKGFGL